MGLRGGEQLRKRVEVLKGFRDLEEVRVRRE
jgi:hypothetical protein